MINRILTALACLALVIAAWPWTPAAAQVFQAVLLHVGTPGAPVSLSHTNGVLNVAQNPPGAIRCTVTVSTATTIQAVGGSCVAPGAGLSIYLTDIHFASNAQGIAADAFATLKYGTGGTCGAGTTVFWGGFAAAAVQESLIQPLATPIKIPANNEVCWINTTAGSKFLVLGGFIAP